MVHSKEMVFAVVDWVLGEAVARRIVFMPSDDGRSRNRKGMWYSQEKKERISAKLLIFEF